MIHRLIEVAVLTLWSYHTRINPPQGKRPPLSYQLLTRLGICCAPL